MTLKIFLTVLILVISLIAGIFTGSLFQNLIGDAFVSVIMAAFGSVIAIIINLKLFGTWLN